MAVLSKPARWHRLLTVRIVLFLSLALFPIGLIAIVETTSLTRAVQARSDLTLLSATEKAVASQTAIIQKTFGAASAISNLVDPYVQDAETCRRHLKAFISASEIYTYAGFQGIDGIVRCSTANRVLDFSEDENFARFKANPSPNVAIVNNGRASREAVMVVSVPKMAQGHFAGSSSVSVPLRKLPAADFADIKPEDVILFDNQANILLSLNTSFAENVFLPDVSLLEHVSNTGTLFHASDQTGTKRTYAVVPLVPDVLFALSVWDVSAAGVLKYPLVFRPGHCRLRCGW